MNVKNILNADRETKIHILRLIGKTITWSVLGAVVLAVGYYAGSKFTYVKAYENGGLDLVNHLLGEGVIAWGDGAPVIANGVTVLPLDTAGINDAIEHLIVRT